MTEFPIIKESNKKTIRINYPWDTSAVASIKNKIKVIGSNLSASILSRMGDSSQIDSLYLAMKILNPSVSSVNPILKKDTLITLLKPGKNIELDITIDTVINSFADSLSVEVTATIPKNTSVILTKSTGTDSLSVDFRTKTICSVPCIWNVKDSIRAVLKSFIIPVPTSDLRIIKKLTKPQVEHNVSFMYKLYFTCSFFGIAADKNHKDELLKLTDAEITPDLLITPKGQNFFAPFGTAWIPLVANQDSAFTKAIYDSTAIGKFIATDSCYIRAVLLFPPTENCIVTKNDRLSIRSNIHLNAITQSDSLIIWERNQQIHHAKRGK